MNEKKLWEEGSSAYMSGKLPEDNPYDPFDDEKHSAWQHGYRMEKDYWENAGQDANSAFIS